jgi:hypothetical protein
MRLTFWLSIGLLALALSACGPAVSFPLADTEGDATHRQAGGNQRFVV